MSKTEIVIDPTLEDIEQIRQALFEENSWFYQHIDSIAKARERGYLIVGKQDNRICCFSVYSCRQCIVRIQYFWVAPDYRRKGIGTEFFNALAELFKSRSVLAISLYFNGDEAEEFWINSIGLSKIGQLDGEHRNTCYRILYENCLKPKDELDVTGLEMVLRESRSSKISTIWQLDRISKDKILIHPGCDNSVFDLYLFGRLVKSDELKYLTKNKSELILDISFLFIDESSLKSILENIE